MSRVGSAVYFRDFQELKLRSFFHRVVQLRRLDEEGQSIFGSGNKSSFFGSKVPTVALLFFEPSTRTQCSFQQSAYKLGFKTLLLKGDDSTSVNKGETLEDTVMQLASMAVDGVVIRAPGNFNFDRVLGEIPCPVINAGWGHLSHPTQGLLDAFTIFDELGDIQGKRVLIAGDVRHSRCAISQMEFFTYLGAEVGVICPEEFRPESERVKHISFQEFSSLSEGLKWANVVIALRVQKERHRSLDWSIKDYVEDFQISAESLKDFSPEGLVMAPGPVNWGVELNEDVIGDSRNRILRQVYNGVFVRAALLERLVLG